MTAAYHGGYETRPNKAYWLQAEKSRLERLARWKKQDEERLDEIFSRFRGRDDVDRDEEKIAEILNRAEERAQQAHSDKLDTRLRCALPSDFLGTTGDNFKQKTRKRFDFES